MIGDESKLLLCFLSGGHLMCHFCGDYRMGSFLTETDGAPLKIEWSTVLNSTNANDLCSWFKLTVGAF